MAINKSGGQTSHRCVCPGQLINRPGSALGQLIHRPGSARGDGQRSVIARPGGARGDGQRSVIARPYV